MNLKAIVLVCIALFSMSGPANAGARGKSAWAEWLVTRAWAVSAQSVTAIGRLGHRKEFVEDSILAPRPNLSHADAPLPKTGEVGLMSEKAVTNVKPYVFDPVMRDITLKKVSSVYDEATPQILYDLGNAKVTLTQERVEEIINAAVTKAIKNAAKETDAIVDFEAATGNLKVRPSYTVSSVRFVVGEINIVKVSLYVVGAVMACGDVDPPAFKACVKTAMANVRTFATKEMDFESKRNTFTPEKPVGVE